jgi:hypothetical protein
MKEINKMKVLYKEVINFKLQERKILAFKVDIHNKMRAGQNLFEDDDNNGKKQKESEET